jgi:hypothetical protein
VYLGDLTRFQLTVLGADTTLDDIGDRPVLGLYNDPFIQQILADVSSSGIYFYIYTESTQGRRRSPFDFSDKGKA